MLLTDRLRLRPARASDAAFVLELLNDPDWLRYIGDRNARSLDDAVRYVEDRLLPSYAEHGFGLDLVEERSTSEAVGLCGLIRRPGLDEVDLGFAFLPAHRGKGYALEAARATLGEAWATHGLARVVAITLPANRSSIALLGRLGFSHQRNLSIEGEADELELHVLDSPGEVRGRAG